MPSRLLQTKIISSIEEVPAPPQFELDAKADDQLAVTSFTLSSLLRSM
jgi:hypothetical protein